MNLPRLFRAGLAGLCGGGLLLLALLRAVGVAVDLAPLTGDPSKGAWEALIPAVLLPGALCFAVGLAAWASGARWLAGALAAVPAHAAALLLVFQLLGGKLYATADQNLAFALLLALCVALGVALGRRLSDRRVLATLPAVFLLLALALLAPGAELAVFLLGWTLIPISLSTVTARGELP